MSRDKKSKVDDIAILRRILDNPTDPGTKQLFSDEEKALASIYSQLTEGRQKPPRKFGKIVQNLDSLEPKVTIRTRIQTHPQLIPSFLPVQPSETIQSPAPGISDFTVVHGPQSLQSDMLFRNEELYEVEKIRRTAPEFTVLPPIELRPSSESVMIQEQQSFLDKNLPEWQLVHESQIPTTLEQEKTTTDTLERQVDSNQESEDDVASLKNTIPEFERIDTTVPEPQEKPDHWAVPSEKEPSIETPLDSSVIESSDVTRDTLTKEQKKAVKKAKRQKEKEEKKQKKLQLKNLRLEKRRKEQEAEQLDTEDQVRVRNGQIPEEPPIIKSGATEFDGMQSIDEKTTELLSKNGYFTIENLRDATIDDLVQIRGIRRKLAKQIKKEAEQKTIAQPESEFVPIKGKTQKKPQKVSSDDFTEWESYHSTDRLGSSASEGVCTYKKYTLYKKITTENKKRKTVHFFSKEKPNNGTPVPLPKGYQIAVNKKTKIPYLKKKK